MRGKITKRQKELLTIIYQSIKEKGFPPSFDEMRGRLEIASNQAIIDHLASLEKKGFIARGEKSARNIKITPLGYKKLGKNQLIPFLGTSPAGIALENTEISGQWQEISDEIVKLNEKVFIVKVKGDSMVNAGIEEGDTLIIKQQSEFVSGDIVLAKTPDGVTIKRFISQDSPPYLFLKPENPKHKIIYFTDEITLQGKVIGKLISGQLQKLTQGSFI